MTANEAGTEAEHAAFRELHGPVQTVDVELVMQMVGRSNTGMKNWAVGFRYESMDAYYAYAAANWQHYGHWTIGPAVLGDGEIYGLLIPDRRDGISALELMVRFRGMSRPADTAMVAALLGRDDIDSAWAQGFAYDSQEAHDALADGNRRHYGHQTLGPVTGPDGKVYGLVVFAKPEPHEYVLTIHADEPQAAVWTAESKYAAARVPVPAGPVPDKTEANA